MSSPLNEYARRILEVFAEAYPASSQIRGGRKLRKGSWEKIFPEITGSVERKEEFLRGVESLVSAGIISVKWKRFREGDETEALYLEDPEKLYALTDAEDPKAVRREMLKLLTGTRPRTDLAADVREALAAKLEVYHDIFVDDIGELRDILTLFDLEKEQLTGRTVRGISVKLFNDSKRIEALLPAADKIARGVTGEGVSEILGLKRSYPEVSFFLDGKLTFYPDGGNDRRSAPKKWDTGGIPLTLPEEAVRRIREIAFTGDSKRVLSVENKETYYTACRALRGRFSAFVYTGGYPNGAVKGLLSLLSGLGGTLYHFGDLDPEGLYIFFEVEKSAGVKVGPFLMNGEVYGKYAEYGYPLNAAARTKLEGIRDPRFTGLREGMKRYGKGVEQEIIELLDFAAADTLL